MINQPAQPVEHPASAVPPAAEQISARLRDFQVADHERRGSGGGRRKRLFLWALAAIVLAGGSMAGYSYRHANNVPEADVFVYTGKPSREVLLDLSGFVVPHIKVVISPQVGGIVSKVLLPEEGKKVKTGALLFTIEDTRYRSEWEQAEAALTTAEAQEKELKAGREPEEIAYAEALLKQAKVQYGLASNEYERARKLPADSIGRAEYDKVLTTYRDTQAAVNVQQKNLARVTAKTRKEKLEAAAAEVRRTKAVRDRAEYFFKKTQILAPADSAGKSRVFTVLQKNVNPGESIQADLVYTALCTLADLDDMEAEVDVQERDLHLVKVGTPCEVIPDAYPDRIYRGHLQRMQPLVNRQRGVVQIKVRIDKPDSYLLPDMNARVLFLKEASSHNSDQDLPRIPLKALVSGSDPPTVLVFDGSMARRRVIEIGDTIGDSVQVRSGLQPEDKVLLPGAQPLQDGKPVRLRGPSKDSGAGRKDPI
ncbi:MAG TPA: efflux RND transporter periplasmic adaptor subunit [Gemmataceae bacterium]|nr:efflux RND transporter periplasmic adaptor subunit [Gemmataceae bacterium]